MASPGCTAQREEAKGKKQERKRESCHDSPGSQSEGGLPPEERRPWWLRAVAMWLCHPTAGLRHHAVSARLCKHALRVGPSPSAPAGTLPLATTPNTEVYMREAAASAANSSCFGYSACICASQHP